MNTNKIYAESVAKEYAVKDESKAVAGRKMPIDELIELITGCVGIKTKDITR